MINDQLKDKVKLTVDRSTHASKLRDFHEWMDAVKKDTLHHVSVMTARSRLSWYYYRPDSIKVASQDILQCSGILNSSSFYQLAEAYNLWPYMSALCTSIYLYSLSNNYSRERYWLLLLVILTINILLLVYYNPDNNAICPISILNQNRTLAIELNKDFETKYVIFTVTLGGLFTFLAIWMLLEYFTVTWPHFVLPEFFYKLCYLLCKKFRIPETWIGRWGIKLMQ